MRCWDNSLRIFTCLYDNGRQGVRRIAPQTGLAQSRVHHLTQAMERRGGHPEAWWWDTAEGRRWLTRWVVATLSTGATAERVQLLLQVVDAIGGRHALYLRPQTQRGC